MASAVLLIPLWPRPDIAAGDTPMPPDPCRLIVNYDEINLWTYQMRWARSVRGDDLSAVEVRTLIEQIVDDHARAGVDRLVHCVFSLPWGPIGPGFEGFQQAPHDGWQTVYPDIAPSMRRFKEAHDLVSVVLDRSRRRNMALLAGLRMNDRHVNAEKRPLFADHPQWHLRSFAALDYKHAAVRDMILAFTAQFLDRYDVDGIELDWMRHCHVFEPSEATRNAPLLTDLVARLRRLLDDQARQRGRARLLLGARVPQTIAECDALGFDVAGWARSGLDYLCPSDFHCIDFNIRVEDFVQRLAGTACSVYPTVMGTISIEGAKRRGLTHEQFRAAAHNYYAHGAAGISAYNFYTQFMILPGNESGEAPRPYLLEAWPRALAYLTALRDPGQVARGDRHYLFYPLHPDRAPTGARKHQVITLGRGERSASGATRLRLSEDVRPVLCKAKQKATPCFRDQPVERTPSQTWANYRKLV